MDLGFSIVSDILFITKHKNDHNFGPNLNIDKILSVLDSPGHSREVKKEQNPLSHEIQKYGTIEHVPERCYSFAILLISRHIIIVTITCTCPNISF